jgi:hypothetical protein
MSIIESEIIDESDFKNFQRIKQTTFQFLSKSKEYFLNNFIFFLAYFLLLNFLVKSFNHKDFAFCNLIIFGILLNHGIKALNQEAAITITITILYFVPKDYMKIFSVLYFYISALFQVFRLKGTKFYVKLRKIRIWGGPIYGCLLFWRILNSYGVLYVDISALLIFLAGVHFRPNYFEEGDYDRNRIIHKYLMITNFSIVTIEDLCRVYELWMM